MAEQAEEQATPLQQKLDKLGSRLAWITLSIAAVVAIAGLLAGRDTVLMIETAIALGVAAVPEGLPIVATIALARGMWLMARRNALVNRLTAVETLGATRVIFTDKTGTLTENKMTVRRALTSAGDHELDGSQAQSEGRETMIPCCKRLMRIGVLMQQRHTGRWRTATIPRAIRPRSHCWKRARRLICLATLAGRNAGRARSVVRSGRHDDGHVPSRRTTGCSSP